MEVVLKKIGNSIGITLAPAVLKDLKLKAGQTLTMSIGPDRTITLTRRKYSLPQMIAMCDFDAPSPADITTWDAGKPVGKEVL